MKSFFKRNEFKHDLFHHDMAQIVKMVERNYPEIKRPYESTLTLYFYDPVKTEPEIDTSLRLRAYSDLPIENLSMQKLLPLHWTVERKKSEAKVFLGELDKLQEIPDDNQEALEILHKTHVTNLVKAVHRRHFAISPHKDERHRITIDYSRLLYKVVDKRLELLGDLGPRIEVKLPILDREDDFPVIQDIAPYVFWLPFGAFELYMQFYMHKTISDHTYLKFPEIEIKHTISVNDPEKTFVRLHAWLEGKADSWRLLLPYPHVFSRVRRYHLCAGPDAECAYTVVETRAGRCSLKTKKATEAHGEILLRRTQASHSTDIDGAKCEPDEFIRQHQLRKLNAFRKAQLKIPVVLDSGSVFQFSVDECLGEDGRILNQIEIEHAGSLNGSAGSVDEILDEIKQVSIALEESPVGAAISPTQVSKYEFFT